MREIIGTLGALQLFNLAPITFSQFIYQHNSHFNVSHNSLTGLVPRGNRFNTFENDSFSANPKLCGHPLSRNCGDSTLPLPPSEDKDADSRFGFVRENSFDRIWQQISDRIGVCHKDTSKYEVPVKKRFAMWLKKCFPILGLVLWWWNEMWYVGLNSRDENGAKLPPGHMGFPYFGEMLSFHFYFKFLRRPDDFINSKRLKYGDGAGLYRSYLFRSPSVIACSPSVIKFVLQSHESFALQWPNTDLMGSMSLVAVHGKSHTRLRNFVTNAINQPGALTRIAVHVQPRIVASLKSWAHSCELKARIQTKRLTFENIAKMFASLEPGPLLDQMDKWFDGVIKGVRAQPSKLPGTACHHAIQCRRKIEAIFAREMEERKNKIRNGENVKNDIMNGLMQIKDEQGNGLSDKEVLDNIVNLIVAGYESTALSSTWAIYYLAKYPEVLKKLREENMAMFEKKKEEFITTEDVSQLKYTNKVVEETIRMANIAQILFRVTKKDVEYKGYTIPKGWVVILWTRYLHTDPENFEHPLCFNPDRWDKPAKPGTYQVFGGGNRICAGNMLARLKVALLLHHLSVGYKWELVNPDADIAYLPHPLPVDGVEITFSKLS